MTCQRCAKKMKKIIALDTIAKKQTLSFELPNKIPRPTWITQQILFLIGKITVIMQQIYLPTQSVMTIKPTSTRSLFQLQKIRHHSAIITEKSKWHHRINFYRSQLKKSQMAHSYSMHVMIVRGNPLLFKASVGSAARQRNAH